MIAISYRRDDSSPIAGRLYDRLEAEFGKGNVFMDFDSIPYGVDFREHIRETLLHAKILVAIIGPDWLGIRDKARRRIDDTGDFVRFEIATALESRIPIIPVLVNNTPMPEAHELPAELEGLAFRNGLALDTGIDFHHHANRLIAGISAMVDTRVWKRSASRNKRINVPDRRLLVGIVALVAALAGILAWRLLVNGPALAASRRSLADSSQKSAVPPPELYKSTTPTNEAGQSPPNLTTSSIPTPTAAISASDNPSAVPSATPTATQPLVISTASPAGSIGPTFSTGSIAINTKPAGAIVTVDHNTGKTPLTLTGIKVGKQRIKIELDGFESIEREIEIEESETTDLGNITLVRRNVLAGKWETNETEKLNDRTVSYARFMTFDKTGQKGSFLEIDTATPVNAKPLVRKWTADLIVLEFDGKRGRYKEVNSKLTDWPNSMSYADVTARKAEREFLAGQNIVSFTVAGNTMTTVGHKKRQWRRTGDSPTR
jgi:PEGA domain-containing protein/TIR domain-containing protein